MNLWSIYAAIKLYLKYCILRSLAFYNFYLRLDFQALEEDWATAELLKIPNWINIANPLPIYAATRAVPEN